MISSGVCVLRDFFSCTDINDNVSHQIYPVYGMSATSQFRPKKTYSKMFVALSGWETVGEQKLISHGIFKQVQSQISNVIEPAAAQLIPIASELNSVYRQIDLLEVYIPYSSRSNFITDIDCIIKGLILRVNENIRQMTTKVERTELALRREERALSDNKPTSMWKEPERAKIFRAVDYVENGKLKDPRENTHSLRTSLPS